MNLNFMHLINALPGVAAQGLIWGIMAIGVYITYKILDVADLTVDGTMCTGGAVYIMLTMAGLPWPAALLGAFLAGLLAGLATGVFHTLCGIPAILAGILTQLALYSVNLRIMGQANRPINSIQYDVLLSSRDVRALSIQNPIFIGAIFVVVIIAVLYWFFGTELGSSLRATGANQNMARAQGINTNVSKVLGLMLSNGLVALSSALLAQYQGFADVNMGRGAIVIGLAAVIIGEVIFGKVFRNFDEAKMAYDTGVVGLHAPIKVRVSREVEGKTISRLIDATVGQIIFNDPIPQDLGFVDRSTEDSLFLYEIDFKVGKKQLSKIIEKCIKVHGTARTSEVLDAIKSQGYKYSTKGALTVAVCDAAIPPEKKELIAEAEAKVDSITKMFNKNGIAGSSAPGTTPPTR